MREERLLEEMCDPRKDAKARFRCFGYQNLAKRHQLNCRSFWPYVPQSLSCFTFFCLRNKGKYIRWGERSSFQNIVKQLLGQSPYGNAYLKCLRNR